MPPPSSECRSDKLLFATHPDSRPSYQEPLLSLPLSKPPPPVSPEEVSS